MSLLCECYKLVIIKFGSFSQALLMVIFRILKNVKQEIISSVTFQFPKSFPELTSNIFTNDYSLYPLIVISSLFLK